MRDARHRKKLTLLGLGVAVAILFLLLEASSSESISPTVRSTSAEAIPLRPSDPCPLMAEGEGEGEGEPAFATPHPAARTLRHAVPLTAAALVAAAGFPAFRRRLGRRWTTAILAACALGAVVAYGITERSAGGQYVNGWEHFHYYLGSKYAPELGYTGLYEAALVADVETGRRFAYERDAIRNLHDGTCIAVDAVLGNRQAVRSRFSAARWDEFQGDIRYFKETLSPARWNGVFRDKGYNPSPVWTMIAAPFANRVATSDPHGLLPLALLDPLLLLVAVAVVWRTFGARTALLMVILIGTHMTTSHSHLKGAFLRTDWVTALVLAVCALKAKRPGVGGALVAYAAAVRVFPALFAVAIVVAAIHRGPRRREHLRFAVAFAVTLVVLLALSALVVVPGTWQGFADKIWQHHDSFSPWRVGFKHLFLGAYEYLPEGSTHQEVFRQRWAPWWALQAVMLLALAFMTRRLEPWETLALGFVPMFFLVAPTYYYYIMLVVPLLFFCGRLPRAECTLGVAWLLASSSLAYLVEDAVGRELLLFYTLSLIVLVVCALMAVSAWRAAPPGNRRLAPS